jgi:hypothetical protein
MGLMRWLRGGDDNASATAVVSAGLAEIDGLFRPSKHKQTEHVEESKRKRVDVANGAGVDLERGVAVVRSKDGTEDADRLPRTKITRTVWVPRRVPWWSMLSPSARRRRRRLRAKSREASAPLAAADATDSVEIADSEVPSAVSADRR